jgi:hypothetical protein
MTAREAIYAVLALLGFAVTWYFNIIYMQSGGSFLDMPAVISLLYANPLSSSFTSDLLVAFFAFVVFSIAEGRRVGMRAWWLYPLLGLTLAFAFAFPLFLLMRERHLRREAAP